MRWIITLLATIVVMFLACLMSYRFRTHKRLYFGLLCVFFFVNFGFMILDSSDGAIDFFLRHQIAKGGDAEAMVFASASFLVVDFLTCLVAFLFGNLGFHISFWKAKRNQGESFGDFLERLDNAKKRYSKNNKERGEANVVAV